MKESIERIDPLHHIKLVRCTVLLTGDFITLGGNGGINRRQLFVRDPRERGACRRLGQEESTEQSQLNKKQRVVKEKI